MFRLMLGFLNWNQKVLLLNGKINYFNINLLFFVINFSVLKVWLFQINPSFINACWVINRVNMLLFKNHKAMTLIYHRNQGDNFWFFFSPFSQIRTKRVHFSPSHLRWNKGERNYFCLVLIHFIWWNYIILHFGRIFIFFIFCCFHLFSV